MQDRESLRYTATEIAWHMLGTPYIWGGDDPMRGFDCSGFCIELLQSVGLLPAGGDWTASGLWGYFQQHEVYADKPGVLVFWQNSQGYIRHVEMCIGDGLSIGASGGGSRTKTAQDAIAQNAYVKIRPIVGRGQIRGYLDPFKEV